MSTHHGKEGVVKIGANTVAETTSFSVQQTADVADDTSQGDTWKTHLVGMNEWSANVECWWDETDTNGQVAMTIGASVTLNLYPEGASTGDKYLSGTATITSIDIGTPKDGIVSCRFAAKGNGQLSNSTAS